jgi:uncharacterized membrane protein
MAVMTLIHIVAGIAALTSGTLATITKKGGLFHKRAGQVFFASMLVMASLGAGLAVPGADVTAGCIGLFSVYLVTTSWLAARAPQTPGDGRIELATGIVCSAIATATVVGNLDPATVIYPQGVSFTFASVMALAAICDISVALRGQLSRPHRIARHLWRMMLAFYYTVSSFFSGQQDVFHPALQGWLIWHLLGPCVLLLMLFWLGTTVWPVARRKRRAAIKRPALVGEAVQ